ncbi:ERC1 [Candida pseudojiufengensis]|uniref:ERC1 n=1 Tax=Candida pseudojiufengensis TaxID=497109 RepID=UPI002224E9D3|nr:ERC1 [Candida pseudojiufengensis]KAI5959879.1 ERC1 [Candida pseudojiufengensis]
MSHPDRSPPHHQFTHSNQRRRASVVYGSIGKGGLYLPSDFINNNENNINGNRKHSTKDFVDENSPLIDIQGDSSIDIEPTLKDRRRKSSFDERELIEQERELLKYSHIPITNPDNEDDIRNTFDEAINKNQIEITTPLIELNVLIRTSLPSVLTFLLQCSLSTVSVFSVGHIGPTELAAVSLGAMMANITGYATIQGLACCLDSYCPASFGAKKYTLVGIYVQKCTALIATVMIPVLIAWIFFGYELLTLIIPDKQTAHLSAVYLRIVAAGIPGYIVFEVGKRFLQAQGIYNIGAYVLSFAAPSNLIMNILLVKHLGYIGAPISVAINYWLMAFGLIISTIFLIKPENTPTGINPLKCWGGINLKQAFSGWSNLASLAIPGLIMLEAEFIAFEILTLMASYINTNALAAQSIGTTMASLTYQVPFAIGIASSSRIANFLGAGLSESAKITTKVSLIFGGIISIINFLALFIFRRPIANAFTNDEKVIEIVLGIMWLIALMQVSDALNANSAGCLRGQGQTKIGGIVNLISYYLIGIPLSIYLSFFSPWKGSLDGLWIGCTVALTIIGVVQSYYALFADFNKLCDDARHRTTITDV